MQACIIRKMSTLVTCAGLAGALLPADVFPGGSACFTGSEVKVCVEWTDPTDPEHGSDFIVIEDDPSNPDLELREGDDWTIYAELVSNGNLANFGDVTTTDSENYTVTISRSGGAGAVNVGSLVLDPAGDTYSSIGADSAITGDLTGDMIVVRDSAGVGGEVGDFTIEGDVAGDISLYSGAGLTIEGDVVGDISMTHGGGFTIEGTYGAAGGGIEKLHAEFIVEGDLTIGSTNDIDIFVDDSIDGGRAGA